MSEMDFYNKKAEEMRKNYNKCEKWLKELLERCGEKYLTMYEEKTEEDMMVLAKIPHQADRSNAIRFYNLMTIYKTKEFMYYGMAEGTI